MHRTRTLGFVAKTLRRSKVVTGRSSARSRTSVRNDQSSALRFVSSAVNMESIAAAMAFNRELRL